MSNPFARICLEAEIFYENRWSRKMAEWLGRLSEKPKRNGELFVGVDGNIQIFKKLRYAKTGKVLSGLATVREESKLRLKTLRSVCQKEWNPFSSIDPWFGNDGLLCKIMEEELLDTFIKHLGIDDKHGLEGVVDWIGSGSLKELAHQMAEALVKTLEGLGIEA